MATAASNKVAEDETYTRTLRHANSTIFFNNSIIVLCQKRFKHADELEQVSERTVSDPSMSRKILFSSLSCLFPVVLGYASRVGEEDKLFDRCMKWNEKEDHPSFHRLLLPYLKIWMDKHPLDKVSTRYSSRTCGITLCNAGWKETRRETVLRSRFLCSSCTKGGRWIVASFRRTVSVNWTRHRH